MSSHSPLRLKNLEIFPPLALAPMVGVSHSALRSIIAELGGAGLFFTEMLSVKRLPSENVNLSPCLIRTEEESPLFYQLFLNDTTDALPALAKLHEIGADGIDINLGCPAPNLRKFGAGCALSENHDIVKKIISFFRKNTELPLSVKIRLGKMGKRQRFLELCRIIEGEGADCLTIHARFNKEKFCRKPHWSCIAHAKNILKIPIIANGGISSVQDGRLCLELSGADGLMVGRAAARTPWLFRELASALYGVELENKEIEPLAIYNRFVDSLIARFTPERRLGRLKQFTHYHADLYPFGHQLATAVQKSKSMDAAIARAAEFFAANEQSTESRRIT